MIEKFQGFARLDGVDQETFERFLQWAYDQRYKAPVSVGKSVDLTQEEGEKSHLDGHVKIEEKMVLKDYEQRRVQRGFVTSRPPFTSPTRSSKSHVKDFTEGFFAHLKLYVFADEKQIEELKTVVLRRLSSSLGEFTLHEAPYADVVGLLRYTYANTHRPSPPDFEPLRKSMMELLELYEPDSLIQNPPLKALIIEDGGDLLTDFLQMLHTDSHKLLHKSKEQKLKH